ncbi:hypothetical protein L950_0208275 [Sphingobacterium sp. IITKGP-BTPF85]|nr:hypothetical protein L950_0208275 [Sphingobacterium sp. IITKGP-BTPF85]
MINATEFAKLAKEELHYLRQQFPSLETGVRIREDITGIMVNRGVLNISKYYEVEASRAIALIQHEVGTTLLPISMASLSHLNCSAWVYPVMSNCRKDLLYSPNTWSTSLAETV